MKTLPNRIIARWAKEDWDDDRMVATDYRYYDADSDEEIELTEEQASHYTWGQTDNNITGGAQTGVLQEAKCPDTCNGCRGESHPCPNCGYCSRQCVCFLDDEGGAR